MHKDMEGRAALITGSGMGIGRASAIALARRGAIVGINDLKPEFVDPVIAEIEAEGGRAVAVVQNVATREGIRAAVDTVAQAAGRFDMLVNNAAWVRYQPLADIQPETLDRMLDIGFKSVIWGMQAAAEAMIPERGGAIVNIASAAALRSAKSSVVYSGIKAGILGLTRAAAADLGAMGIRVNAICPSAIPTEGTAKHRSAERDAMRAARTPLGRLGTVDEIAEAVAFLCSDAARFINAEQLTVDGGINNTNL